MLIFMHQLYHRVKATGYDVMRTSGESQITFTLFFDATKYSPTDIIPQTLTMKKLMKMRIFTI